MKLDWNKIWRYLVIIAIVILVIVACVLYFKNGTVITGLGTVLAFIVGAIGGYTVRGLINQYKK